MSTDQLRRVYVSMIRPVAEYASSAWHSLLTKEQANQLESQQNQAMKNILGLGISARRMREKLNLSTLYERRENAVLKFAQKCTVSERFGHWFSLRAVPTYERRSSVRYRQYNEQKCRTDRHQRSPLNYMRRKLNQTK